MKQEIKEFLEEIVENNEIRVFISKKAQELLDQDLKEEVLKLWEYNLGSKCLYSTFNREKYKDITRTAFVYEISTNSDKVKFVEKNWDKLDQIIKIIQDYIKEIEEQEELEEKEK